MSRLLTTVIGLHLLACTAHAQWMYPAGYGGYGMSRWGSDPAAGYMAGLGSFARSQGVYRLDKARADSINADTMIKWNKALRADRLLSAKSSAGKQSSKKPRPKPV